MVVSWWIVAVLCSVMIWILSDHGVTRPWQCINLEHTHSLLMEEWLPTSIRPLKFSSDELSQMGVQSDLTQPKVSGKPHHATPVHPETIEVQCILPSFLD